MSEYSDGSEKSWLDNFGWQIPLAILIVTFLAVNAIQTGLLIQQHGQASQWEQQLKRDDVKKDLEQAQLVAQKLDALVREIVALAPTDPTAQKIQADFRIQLNGQQPHAQ